MNFEDVSNEKTKDTVHTIKKDLRVEHEIHDGDDRKPGETGTHGGN